MKKKVIIIIIAAFLIIIFAIFGYQQSNDNNSFGKAKVPAAVQRWRPLVSEIANKYGVGNYTEVLLAIICQESGGGEGTNDIMQSSESEGLSPNAIQDPQESLNVGIKYFKSIADYANKKKCNFATIIQSYNFGQGYVDYVASHGGKSTKELVVAFASAHGGSYGDKSYYDHVMRYVDVTSTGGASGSSQSPLSNYDSLIKTAEQFQGQPYVFGGDSPSTGFDCSGLTQWVYGQNGIKLPRTAQEQYDSTSKVAPGDVKQGDLVFFTATYQCGDYITHVGIYVGNNTMYQSGGHGIGYTSLNNSFWQQHLAGYGRVRN